MGYRIIVEHVDGNIFRMVLVQQKQKQKEDADADADDEERSRRKRKWSSKRELGLAFDRRNS